MRNGRSSSIRRKWHGRAGTTRTSPRGVRFAGSCSSPARRGPSGGLVTGILEVPPGASVLLHHHEPEETYYVVSGHGRMAIDGRESALGPGSAVFIPSNARHAVHCTGTEPLVLVFAFARDRLDQVVYRFDA